jgi:hypothetical protein
MNVERSPLASASASRCALNGEPWAISQVADRIDGKATAEIQTEQRHARRAGTPRGPKGSRPPRGN